MTKRRKVMPSGKAVGGSGGPVVDPTKNVLDLVNASNLRQDDLRAAEQRRITEALEHVQRMAELRASHALEMRKAEADRLDSIRAVDQGQIQRAAEVQLASATALAASTATMAETLRGQVAAAAIVQASALAASDAKQAAALANGLAPLQKAIEELRQAQFLTAGSKAQVGESRTNYGAILGGISVLLVLVFGLLSLR